VFLKTSRSNLCQVQAYTTDTNYTLTTATLDSQHYTRNW